MTVTGDGGYAEFAEVSARRFNLGCLVALLPRELRPAALAELVEADPEFFHLGHDHPRAVTESAAADGTTPVRQALARSVHDEAAQQRLLALGELGIDTALADNPKLSCALECELRRRRPAVVATARAYRPDNHRVALLSQDDPELVAAALIDRHVPLWGRPHPPTVWAAAWRTVRLRYGAERVRELLAALPADRPLDKATLEVARACAEPDPEPFLCSIEDRFTGTGALLRRLREVRTRRDWEAGRGILAEPYRIDWNLVASAGLDRRLPRMAAEMLARQPGCPAPVAHALVTGRPAPREHTSAGSSDAADAPTPPAPANPAAQPDTPVTHPYYRKPPDPGPLGEGDPETVLRTTAINKALTIDHVYSAVELGLIDAATAVRLARPAVIVVTYAGQESSFHAYVQEPGGGREAFHEAAISDVAARLAAAPPVHGLWTQVSMLIRSFEGTLPELLHLAAAGRRSPG
jgi:hypothetical protein